MNNEKEIVKKFTEELVNNQVDIPGEIRQVADEHFWDLVNDDWPLVTTHEPTCSIIGKSSGYTKTEIENRLYALIDNKTIFPPSEDMSSAYKLLNNFLDCLE